MKYLGLDLGSKTLGIAKGQGIIASSWKTLRFAEHNYDEAIKLLDNIIKEYLPDQLILGYPLNMDGSVGPSAENVRKFKDMITEDIKPTIEVILVDERRSSFQAKQVLIGANITRKKQKIIKDQMAATIILQSYFDKLNQK